MSDTRELTGRFSEAQLRKLRDDHAGELDWFFLTAQALLMIKEARAANPHAFNFAVLFDGGDNLRVQFDRIEVEP